MSLKGGKGWFAKGKRAGLFFPHENGDVRLPRAGETWQLGEGPKDPAALYDLGFLACGLNTCRLAAKFARLFIGVNVILIPDRDLAGENGAQHSARVLRRFAASVRIAMLPAEFNESKGADVRDILRRPDGRNEIRQAIEDAQLAFDDQEDGGSSHDVTADIELPEGDPVKLTVSPAGTKPQRLVVAERGEDSHRDRINTDSAISRDRFVKKVAAKLDIEVGVLGPLVDPKLTELADQAGKQASRSSDGGDDDKDSQATTAANMAAEWDLWHTPGGDAYATIPVGEHNETWPIKSRTFKRYVAKRFFEEEGKAINSEAISTALNLMEAKALFDGDEYDVHVRVAEHNGNIYLDPCNSEWQAVEITPSGWQVINEPPVRFRRSRGMLPLPIPETGGNIDQLRDFLNVDDNAWRLIVAWLLSALRPRGPYPLLALFAEHGSGKSTAGRIIRSLVDPNSAPLRSEHRDARDLMIGANNSWCLAYDNLSYVPSWLSDALCRLSTGGGFATRELYTDQDEIIFDSQRPVMLTSIEEVATRSDALDRCLIICLPAIPDEQRRREEEIETAFEKVRPQVLGALLDGVSGALRDLPNTKFDGLPRMADFALWITAAEKSLGWCEGAFLAAYEGNRDSANLLALESSPFGPPLLKLLEEDGEWCGTATALLEKIEDYVTEQQKRQKAWPKNGRSVSGHLKRLAPNLRQAGWDAKKDDRTARSRTWTIRRIDIASSPEFASHVSVTADECRSVETDAKPCSLSCNDANDADDANSRPYFAGEKRNGDEWEEGEL